MSDIQLSVVVPTRNRAASLERLLCSLARQSLPNSAFEVLVVDDGSMPVLDEGKLRELSGLRLKVLRRLSHHGAHQARTHGVQAAGGKRVLFLDDDVDLTTNVLAQHASVEAGFAVGPIFYPRANTQSPYHRLQARNYKTYFGVLAKGPDKVTNIEFFICNASGPREEFAEFMEAVMSAMDDLPLGGEGYDESIMGIEAGRRGYCYKVLRDAIVWHHDDRSLMEACRGRQRNARIAARIALRTDKPYREIDEIFDIAGVIQGRNGMLAKWRARSVWLAPRIMQLTAKIFARLADSRLGRLMPIGICYLPLGFAFWQGVREEVASWNGLVDGLVSVEEPAH